GVRSISSALTKWSAISRPVCKGADEVAGRNDAHRPYLFVVDHHEAVHVRSLHDLRRLAHRHLRIGGDYRGGHQMSNAKARPAMPQMFGSSGPHHIRLADHANQYAVS